MKGSSSRSGVAPDPSALRRNRPSDAASWRVLPVEGRKGKPPEWPLTQRSKREVTWWARLWKMPQAVAWDDLGQVQEVALYVRCLVLAEAPDASVAVMTARRQMADALGLTIPGLRANRWSIGVAPGQQQQQQRSGKPRAASVRDRLKVVPADGS